MPGKLDKSRFLNYKTSIKVEFIKIKALSSTIPHRSNDSVEHSLSTLDYLITEISTQIYYYWLCENIIFLWVLLKITVMKNMLM